MELKEFFNEQYEKYSRYWWLNDNRYSVDNKKHLPFYSKILDLAKDIKEGKVLDIGAGEGSDAIRLAKLGFEVDAIELTEIGSEKIEKFAKSQRLKINVINGDINTIEISTQYDIILCNGILHYIEDKEELIMKIQNATKLGGINSYSLFSTYTPTPDCHKIVSVFPDNENGILMNSFKDWTEEFLTFERNRQESSHPGMESHHHSYIKLITRK